MTDNNFTSGSIPRKMLKFMLPILGALALQAMYGAVDMAIVGKFGTTEGLSAVSTGSAVINFFMMLIAGLTVGITLLIGRYIGEGAEERVSGVVGGVVCFFGCLAVLFTGLIIVLAEPLAILMQSPPEALALTAQYISICGAGIVFTIGYNVISGIFRGIGNSRLPLLFVAAACAANVGLDLLFVAVWKMNVAGAALATIIAQALSVALSLVVIRKKASILAVSRKDIRFNQEVGRFCRLGLPITLQSTLANVSFLLICAIINNLGLATSSGYGAAQKINSFVMLLPGTLMQSISAFVAQNVGAGQIKRAKKATWFAMTVGASIGTVIFYLAFFHGEMLAGLFSDDPAVIRKAAEYLKGFSPEPIITCISFSLIGYFNGSGKTLFTMMQGLAQSFLVRIPITYIMSLRPDVTLTEIGLAVPASTAFGIVLCVCYYFRLERKGELPGVKLYTQQKNHEERGGSMQDPNFRIPTLNLKKLNSIKTKHLELSYCDASPSQILDIYLPENTAKPYPVIVHFHGGAFMLGTQRDDNLMPMLCGLEKGYSVVSVQYRMSGEARFPALIWDAKAALRWIRAHAEEYGFDKSRIAAWGPSAGGYIVAMLGVTANNPVFEDLSQGNADSSSEVQAVIDWCGPAGGFLNMDKEIRENGIGPDDHDEPMSPESRIMGAPILTIPELVELAAPYRYAHKNVPPFLIIHGEADPVVPVQQSRTLAAAIEKSAGKERVCLITYPDKGHHGEPWYEETEITNICFGFLDKVFAVDPTDVHLSLQ